VFFVGKYFFQVNDANHAAICWQPLYLAGTFAREAVTVAF